MKAFFTRRLAVPVWVLAVAGLVFVSLLGAAGAPEDDTDVETSGTTTTTRRIVTTTTLSPAQQAAAAQAAAERVAAQERAAAERAAAEKAAAEKAAAEKAAAERAAAEQAAAEAAARAPRTISGTGSKVSQQFTLVEGGYRVSWSARGSSDNFIVHVRTADGGDEGLVNELYPETPSGEEFFESPGGAFFLQVDASELSWTVTFTKL